MLAERAAGNQVRSYLETYGTTMIDDVKAVNIGLFCFHEFLGLFHEIVDTIDVDFIDSAPCGECPGPVAGVDRLDINTHH